MLTVRQAMVADAAVVAGLIDDMDAHYRGAGNTRGVAHATLMVERAILSGEGTRFLLACDGDAAVGLACFAVLRPGFRHQGVLFLKDLFVTVAARRRGVARLLMRELAVFAEAHRIGRIDLTTDTGNAAAAALYRDLGGERQDKIMFRFEREALARLAASDHVEHEALSDDGESL